jgi:hypothetical protein
MTLYGIYDASILNGCSDHWSVVFVLNDESILNFPSLPVAPGGPFSLDSPMVITINTCINELKGFQSRSLVSP